jgi:molecular chaperone GrpE
MKPKGNKEKHKIEIASQQPEGIEEEKKQDPAPSEEPEAVEPAAGQEIESLKQQLQRLAADYQNYQKRALRQIEQAGQLAEEKVAKELLPVLDNFEHALEKSEATQDIEALLKGIQIIYDHLLNVLQRHGMQRIEVTPGMDFNPAMHEAMMHEQNKDYPDHTVVRELAKGYLMNERTLRPAKVSVNNNPAATVSEPAAEPEPEPNMETLEDEQDREE